MLESIETSSAKSHGLLIWRWSSRAPEANLAFAKSSVFPPLLVRTASQRRQKGAASRSARERKAAGGRDKRGKGQGACFSEPGKHPLGQSPIRPKMDIVTGGGIHIETGTTSRHRLVQKPVPRPARISGNQGPVPETRRTDPSGLGS